MKVRRCHHFKTLDVKVSSNKHIGEILSQYHELHPDHKLGHPLQESLVDEGVQLSPEKDIAVKVPTEQILPKVPPREEIVSGRGGYFHRLYGCIHAAASKLQDSEKNKKRATKRVEILVELIPKEPTLPLGELTLCMIAIISHSPIIFVKAARFTAFFQFQIILHLMELL